MKLAVVGSRTFTDRALMRSILAGMVRDREVTEIVSGGARGADRMAEDIAHGLGVKVTIFYPDWDRFGNRAGFLRNYEIEEYSDACIAFWDGESAGAKMTIDLFKEKGKPIDVYKFREGEK